MNLFDYTYFLIFFIICLGIIIGRIKVMDVSLDTSAVLFVALAFGHFGYVIPADFQKIGLILFVFTIGIQSGAGFFESFKEKSFGLFVTVAAIIGSGATTTYVVSRLFDIDIKLAVGLFAGALTSTPGLAAAIESAQSPLASIGYGIAYPVGIIGVILFVKILPKIMNVDLAREIMQEEAELQTKFPVFYKKTFIVENKNVDGKSIGELNIQSMTGAIVSMVNHGDDLLVPNRNVTIELQDYVEAVGTEESLNRIGLLLGKEVDIKLPLGSANDSKVIVVTNKEAVNKTIAQLQLQHLYNAVVAKVKRGAVEIEAGADTIIKFGDQLLIICAKEQMETATSILGNEVKKLSETDFLPVAAGISLGILLGKINISFAGLELNLGLTGGVLLTALILNRIGKTGPIIWTLSSAGNQLLRKFGLFLFLSTVGTTAGSTLADTLLHSGFKLFGCALIIAMVPMLVGLIVGEYFFKLPFSRFLGALVGGMTSTPGLSAANTVSESDSVNLAYATVYPVALVIMIIAAQVLGGL